MGHGGYGTRVCVSPAVARWCVVNVLISCRCKIYHLAPMFANYCPGPAVVRGQQRPSSSLHSLFGCPVSSSSRSPAPRRDGDRRAALGAAQQLCNLSGRHHTHWRSLHTRLFGFANFTPEEMLFHGSWQNKMTL